jgi:fructose-specific component phosphotransferase system IIB-like protein
LPNPSTNIVSVFGDGIYCDSATSGHLICIGKKAYGVDEPDKTAPRPHK